jgi:superfamily II DNA or RNA helicase
MALIYGLQHDPDLAFTPALFYYDPESGVIERQIYQQHLAEFAAPEEILTAESLLSLMEKIDKPWLAKNLNIGLEQLPQYLNHPKTKSSPLLKNLKARREKALEAFLQAIIKYDCTFGIQLKREDLISRKRIKIAKETTLHARFERLSASIHYSLSLFVDGQGINLIGQSIEILLKDPGFCIVNQTLLDLHGAKATLLNPFLTKSEVVIPEARFDEFLKVFFAPLTERDAVEIETIGIPINTIEHPTISHLKIEQQLESGKWGAYLVHQYGDLMAHPWTRKMRFSKIVQQEQRAVILQIIRNPLVEHAAAAFLQSYPLGVDGLFLIPAKDPKEVALWLEEIEQALPNNVRLGEWLVKGKKVYRGREHFKMVPGEQKGDWFDLDIEIQIGSYQIHFNEIAEAIRRKQDFLTLPNRELFLIPLAWRAQIKAVFSHQKKNGKLHKSLLHLLDSSTHPSAHEPHQEDLTFTIAHPNEAAYRTYQLQGIQQVLSAYNRQSGFLLADDMGLGKTIQMLGVIATLKQAGIVHNKRISMAVPGMQLSLFDDSFETSTPQQKPGAALVAVPNALVTNWFREAKRFFPELSVLVHAGPNRATTLQSLSNHHLIVVSHHTLRQDIQLFSKQTFPIVILDEAQAIKNPDAQLAIAMCCLQSPFKIALTGTPIENSLNDLWSIFKFAAPEVFGELLDFKAHYLQPIQQNREEEALKMLSGVISPFMLRRTKKEVVQELPDVEVQLVYNEMTPNQAELYDTQKSQIRNLLLKIADEDAQKLPIHIFNALTKLRQLANHPLLVGQDVDAGKHPQLIGDLESLVQAGNKALVFSSFVKHLDLIADSLKTLGIQPQIYHGGLSARERQQIVDTFQQDPDQSILLMSLKAGGTGLNLTAADFVILADPWWNPMAEQQAIARVHRIGQTQRVTVRKYITLDSVEEKIFRLQADKQELADAFLNLTEHSSMEQVLLRNQGYLDLL